MGSASKRQVPRMLAGTVLMGIIAAAWAALGLWTPHVVLPDGDLGLGAEVLERPRSVAPAKPWNVILVSIDTLRADHLTIYGYERATSPKLERFATEAVVFEQAYSHAPKTAPSHMSMMTSLYPTAHGIRNWSAGRERRLSPDVPTLATLLRDAGYRTVAVTNGGMVRGSLGFDQGFDRYTEVADVGQMVDGALAALATLGRPSTGSAAAAPFFLFLHTYEPHAPYVPPGRYADTFVDRAYQGRIPSSDQAFATLLQAHGASASPGRFFFSQVERANPADLRQLRDLYDAEILYTDQQLGLLIEAVRSGGLMEDTLVILLSDHGEEFLDHGDLEHRNLYQEVLHVPLVIRLPRAAGAGSAARRVSAVVRLVDVLPTVLDLLGLPIPAHAQGRSLQGLLRGETERRPRWVLSEFPGQRARALRGGSWKLILSRRGTELYDLATDPAERRDVHHRHPAVAAALKHALAGAEAAMAPLAARAAPGDPRAIDPGVRQRLEALGYVGPDQ